jgi:alpha-mannosidase
MKLRIFLLAIIICCLANISGLHAQKKLYLISNSHLDTQWNWTVKKTIDEYIPNTFDGNFLLFDKYPGYVFNFEGAIKYKWLKEYYPEKYERLKTYVQSGQWNISGFSVDANDVNVPSSESLIRNFLLGQSFYKKEFGTAGSRDIMLPDCFGFGYNLPSIAAHCGILGFHSQKLSWGSAYGIPFTFGMWQGVDGNSIPAILKLGKYDEQAEFKKELTNNQAIIDEINKNGQTLGVYSSPRYFGKMGDIGGAPDDDMVSWLQTNITKTDGAVRVLASRSDDFFKDLTPAQKSALPVWNNELLMTRHGSGCYTSQAAVKRWNRKNELLADAAEKSSVLAHWLGGASYDSEKLNDAWFRVLWHQFHDDLTGTSIPQAYTYTWNDEIVAQNSFAAVMQNTAGAIIRSLDTRTEGEPIVVYNPLSVPRTETVEATLGFATQPAGIEVYDGQNNKLTSQITGYSQGRLSFIFTATVPSMGYAVFDVRTVQTAPVQENNLLVTTQTLENAKYKITVNASGDVSSILDKQRANRELLKAPIRLALLSNNSTGFPAWEIMYSDLTATPLGYVDESVSVSVHENGPLRSTLKVSRTKDNSVFIQYISIYGQGNTDRIDFRNEVEWNTQNRLLKAVFPLSSGNDKATYDISLGTIERGNNNTSLHEVIGHQWADVGESTGSAGISILNDCKYGWDKPDNNTLRLTLIHTPNASNYGYQRFQDLGYHEFTYSFYSHSGSWAQAGTQWQAAQLNQPLMAFHTSKHDGSLGKSVSLAQISTSQVAIKACKKAEDRDEIIVRLYELNGVDASNIELTFPAEILSASEVNGVEEPIGSVRTEGNKLIFDIRKYQPKSFAVKLATAPVQNTLTLPASNPVSLTYNTDVVSSDNNKTDGDFCGTGISYPAELFPSTLTVEDIRFTLGSTATGANNAVKCQGQKIMLNIIQDGQRLYILAAANDANDREAEFLINGVPQRLNIQHFTQFVGQLKGEFTNGLFKTEKIAATFTHRHNKVTNKNESYQFNYIFRYALALPAGNVELTLPNDEMVVVFAATVAQNPNDETTPAYPLMDIPKQGTSNSDVAVCGTELKIISALASASVNSSESADKAIDGDSFTKWCDNRSSAKWLEINLENRSRICGWSVLHAASERVEYITKNFRLQKYENNNWIDVDVVTENTSNNSVRLVNTFEGQRLRLYIDQAESASNNASRIYEIRLFGSPIVNAVPIVTPNSVYRVGCFPNPVENKTATWELDLPEPNMNICIDLFDLAGAKTCTFKFQNSLSGLNRFTWNVDSNAGMYLYRVRIEKNNELKYAGSNKLIVR